MRARVLLKTLLERSDLRVHIHLVRFVQTELYCFDRKEHWPFLHFARSLASSAPFGRHGHGSNLVLLSFKI